jgi:hypothetical protein
MATPTTLPASFVAGNILEAAQLNNLRGAFRVLQVVSGTTSTPVTSSTTSFADTGLTATITPTSTSSKILVLINHPASYKSAGSVTNALQMDVQRNGSTIVTISKYSGYTNSLLVNVFGNSASYFDSPASVSALTYKTRFANLIAAADVGVQHENVPSTITLMEISA